MFNALKDYIINISISMCLIGVFSAICTWRMFVKAGVEGFWSLVPLANIYKFFKIARNVPVLQILGIILLLVGSIGCKFIKLLFLSSIAGLVVFSVGMILLNVKLFERFGYKSLVWLLVAIACPILGYAVIAFNPYTEYEW